MKISRGFAYIILIIIIAAFAAIGVVGYIYSEKKQSDTDADASSSPVNGTWNTYTNERYGFGFMYPPEWKAFKDTGSVRFGENEDTIFADILIVRPMRYDTGEEMTIAEYADYDPNDPAFSLITLEDKKAIVKSGPQIGTQIYIPLEYGQVLLLSLPDEQSREFKGITSTFRYLPVTGLRIKSIVRTYDGFDVYLSDNTRTIVPYPEDWGREGVAGVQEVDINFDGYDDLEVAIKAGAYNSISQFYTYNPRTKSFDVYEEFAGHVSFDPEQKTIETFWRGRGIGDMYSKSFYIFADDTWQLVMDESQTMIDGGSAYDSESGYYANTVREYKGGKVVKETVRYFHNVSGPDGFTFVEISPEKLPF